MTLEHLYLVGERGADQLHLLPTFVAGPDGELRPNPDAARLDARNARDPGWRGRPRTRLRTPEPGRDRRAARRRSRCCPRSTSSSAARAATRRSSSAWPPGSASPSRDERARIREIADAKTAGLADDDLDVLRYDQWLAGLEAGFAAHHAGMVPPMKEAVEEAFADGLVKVVFATETLALGINMPARSVVIEKLSKFTGERHEFLTPGEYTQLTGRAGPARHRRARATPSCCWSPFVPFDQVASLASRRSDALRSSFRPTYNMAANLVRRYTKFEAHHLLNLSFAQYHADRDVVTLERQLDRTEQQVAAPARAHRSRRRRRSRSTARSATELETLRRNGASAGRRITEAMEALRPGDVVVVRRRGGRVAVLEPRAPAGRRQPPGRGHTGSRRRAPGPPGLRRAAPARRHHRSPDAVRAPQPGVPPPGRRSAAAGEAARRRRTYAPRGTAPGRAGGRPRRAPAEPRPATRAEAAGRRRARALRARRAAHRAAGAGPQREPRPPVRPRPAGAGGVGLRRRLAAHRRRGAAGPPLHRDRPAARGGAA